MSETRRKRLAPVLPEHIDDFVKAMVRLANPKNPNRAALAALRSGLKRIPGEDYPPSFGRMVPYVAPSLGETELYGEHWFYVVAALFADHQENSYAEGQDRKGKTLGESLYQLRPKKEGSDEVDSQKPVPPGLNMRFTALLNSRAEHLPDHLRHAVSLLAAQKPAVSVNFKRLLRDCLQWDAPGRPVQIKWARDFYAVNKADNPASAATNDQTGEKE